ncbi:MAG: EI24 domain-containing protein [Sphingorhabdus sp.]
MLRAISLAFSSLSDKRVMLVLVKVIALTLAAFIVLGVVLWYAIDAAFAYYLPSNDGMAGAAATLAALAFSGWILFRSLAVAFTWVFADDIIDAVEDRHYPFYAAQGQRPSFAKATRMGLRSIGRALGYNLLMVPVYLLLLVSGVGTPLAFLAVNGYLLGRDLEDMLVARHGPMRAEIGAIRRFVLGLGSVAAMLIPIFQFFVPVLATAAAVHVAHDKTGKI